MDTRIICIFCDGVVCDGDTDESLIFSARQVYKYLLSDGNTIVFGELLGIWELDFYLLFYNDQMVTVEEKLDIPK